jgi:hypothetical protein
MSVRLSNRMRAIGALASAALLSCADRPSEPPHPIVGTYDVISVLDSFYLETACSSPVGLCVHSSPANGATLTGVLVIGKGLSGSGSTFRSTDVRGTFTGRFCDIIDHVNLGCSVLGDPVTLDYPEGELFLSFSFAVDVTIQVLGPGSSNSDHRYVALHHATFAGDSISGRVSWAMQTTRSPPAFGGTFVARKRR